MADSERSERLTREGEPGQMTEKELEMPVSRRGEFFGAPDRAAKKSLGKASRSGSGKVQTFAARLGGCCSRTRAWCPSLTYTVQGPICSLW